MASTKVCTDCQRRLPLGAYHVYGKNALIRCICRMCLSERAARWNKRHPRLVRKYAKRHKQKVAAVAI